MIIVRPQGGLGNQFFQFAAARALAAKFGGRPAVDLAWYRGAGKGAGATVRAFVLDRFAVNYDPVPIAELRAFGAERRDRPGRVLGRIRRLVSGRTWYREGTHGSTWVDLEGLGSRVYLDGYFQDSSFVTMQDEQLRRELVLKDAIPDSIHAAVRRVRCQQTVCIQIRRTDYLNNAEVAAVHGVLGSSYYRTAWAEMRRRYPDCAGLVFSDDREWAAQELGDLPNVSLAPTDWDGPDYLHKFHLMQQCRHYILANSTFGWWAAWLGATEGSTVLLPQHWFRRKTLEQTGLLVRGWEAWSER